jgi:hypothetical protein
MFKNFDTEMGVEYKVVVEYSPRPRRESSSDAQVLWNGQVIGELSGAKAGWQLHEFKVIGTGRGDRLALAGAGKEDSLGALVDYVQVETSQPCQK